MNTMSVKEKFVYEEMVKKNGKWKMENIKCEFLIDVIKFS